MFRITESLSLPALIVSLQQQMAEENDSVDHKEQGLIPSSASSHSPVNGLVDDDDSDVQYSIVGVGRNGAVCVARTDFRAETCSLFCRDNVWDDTCRWSRLLNLTKPAHGAVLPGSKSSDGSTEPPPCGDIVSAAVSEDQKILVYSYRVPFKRDVTAYKYRTVCITLPDMVWRFVTEGDVNRQWVQALRTYPPPKNPKEYTAYFMVSVFPDVILELWVQAYVRRRVQKFKDPKIDYIFAGKYVWSWYNPAEENIYIIYKMQKERSGRTQNLRIVNVESPKKRDVIFEFSFPTSVVLGGSDFNPCWPLPCVVPRNSISRYRLRRASHDMSSDSSLSTTPIINPEPRIGSPIHVSESAPTVSRSAHSDEPPRAAEAAAATASCQREGGELIHIEPKSNSSSQTPDLFASPRVNLQASHSLPLVRLLNGSCGRYICIQKPFEIHNSELARAIPIVVISLNSGIKVEYSIPIEKNPIDEAELMSIRVVFEMVAGCIAVYIPGHFLHFIDLDDHHNPIPGVFLKDQDATPLPQMPDSKYPVVSSFDLFVDRNRDTKDDRKRLLDIETGQTYEYSISNEHLLKLVVAPKTTDQGLLQLIHFVVVHLHSKDLSDQVLRKLLVEKSNRVTIQLLKEFAVCLTYDELRDSIPRYILNGIPSTTTDQKEACPDSTGVNNFSIRPLNHPLNHATYPLKRYWRVVEKPAPKFLQNHPDVRQDYTTVVNTLVSLFGAANVMPQAKQYETDVCYCDDVTFSALNKAFILMHPKDSPAVVKQNLSRLLKEQNTQLGHIDDVICSVAFDNFDSQNPDKKKAFKYFITFLRLLDAATELGGQLPDQFFTDLGQAAIVSLPRVMLRQYIDRGIIPVTEVIIFQLEKEEVDKTDPDFFYFVLCKLPEERIWHHISVLSKTRQVSEDERPIPFYVLQHFAKRNPWIFQKPAKGPSPDLSCCERSPLVPLQLLTSSLALDDPATHPCVPEDDMIFHELISEVKSFNLNFRQVSFPEVNEPPSDSSSHSQSPQASPPPS